MTQEGNIRDPVLAGFLSLFLPGLGQIYLRQLVKGAVWLIANLGLDFIACFLVFVPTSLPAYGMAGLGLVICAIPLIAALLSSIVSALDAFILAQRVNRGLILAPWEFFITRP